jgi:GH18 family chitinase
MALSPLCYLRFLDYIHIMTYDLHGPRRGTLKTTILSTNTQQTYLNLAPSKHYVNHMEIQTQMCHQFSNFLKWEIWLLQLIC